MRNAFADEVFKIAQEDDRLILLSGDIGNKLFDKFKTLGQSRFFNCGVAEANMMGVAAGMALSGLRPFVYTITPFTTTRCYEQIRVDVCYHNAPVVIVGTGSGLSYADLGPTHHSLEDIAILRALPGMQVFAPCDTTELRLCLRETLSQNSPAYIRIGKKGEPLIHQSAPAFKIGRALVIRPGSDVALLCAGNMMAETIKTADMLSDVGVSAEVTSFHTIKPLDKEYLASLAQRVKLIVTIEEHGCIGGFSSAVAEWRSMAQANIDHLFIGIDDVFMHEVGSQQYAREKFGLTAQNIVNKINQKLNLKQAK